MNKIIITLFIMLLSACSNVDMSGYTSSVLKKATESSDESLIEENLSSNESTSLEDDFSSLDEESLKEELLNYYPWPKPKADPEPNDGTREGTFDLPHNPYDGRIETFSWKESQPSFEEAENIPVIINGSSSSSKYPYGFDRDPTYHDPIVYVSVEIGPKSETNEIAYVQLNAPLKGAHEKTKYRLLYEYCKGKGQPKCTRKDARHGTEITIGAPIPIKGEEDGIHELYQSIDGSIGKYKETGKKIKLIPYTRKIKPFIYVEINGEGLTDLEKANSFTADVVRKKFNEVYNQAVVYEGLKNMPPKELQKFFTDRKDSPQASNDYYNATDYQKAVIDYIRSTTFDITKIEYNITYPNNFIRDVLLYLATFYHNVQKPSVVINFSNYDYGHIVYAINKETKIWNLGKCINDDFSLKNCAVNPEDEDNPDIKYYMYNSDDKPECRNMKGELMGSGVTRSNAIEVDIRSVRDFNTENKPYEDFTNTRTVRHYFIFKKGDNKRIKFSNCDVLFTKNGYPKIPTSTPGAAGLSTRLGAIEKDYSDRFAQYMPYGSIIFAAREKGESAQYTLIHELGHSFGLTDVTRSYLYRKKDIDNKGKYGNGSNSSAEYKNLYATSETNVMTWQQPTGKKIRYRGTPIACTGGTMYYYKTEDDKKILKLSIERLIENGFENQWECIRDCQENKDLRTNASADYWRRTGRCKEEKDIDIIYAHAAHYDNDKEGNLIINDKYYPQKICTSLDNIKKFYNDTLKTRISKDFTKTH